jgi:two-component system NtrC family sensor kinase
MGHQLSLRTRIAILVLLGVIVPAGLRVAVSYLTDRRQTREVVEQRALTASRTLSAGLSTPLWNLDRPAIQGMIDAFGRNADFIEIEVADPQKSFVVFTHGSNALEPTIAQSSEVTHNGRVIGTVRIMLTDAPELAQVVARVRENLLVVLIQSVFSFFIIMWVMATRVHGPIERLVDQAGRMTQGDLDHTVEQERGVEFGRLSRALDVMRHALKRSMRDRDVQVEERTRALQKTNHDLQSAMRQLIDSEKQAALGNLVAGVAHELNTPLGNVLMVASTLAERIGQLDAEYRAGSLRKSTMDRFLSDCDDATRLILKSTERAAKLVTQFKGVAIDQSSNRRMKFDLAEVVDSAIASLKPSLKHAGVDVVTAVAAGIEIDSYPGAVEGIVINSVMNSVLHAYPEGRTGTVTVSGARDESGGVRLTVADDGCGMSVEVRSRIFEPFFTTKLGQGGSGLGLYLVHTLISGVLGGEVTVQSAPEKGTRFHFDLPLIAPRSEGVTAP